MTDQLSDIRANPFAVKTPENLSAEELVKLFVPYPEFENLQITGHQFLNGHRGSGKSMMLRMMAPDSQELYRNCDLFDLPYFGIYLSIKATELNAPEYIRLQDELGGIVISEHVLTTKLLSALFSSLLKHCLQYLSQHEIEEKFRELVLGAVIESLKYAGWKDGFNSDTKSELLSAEQILKYIIKIIDDIQLGSAQYIKRRSFISENQPYQGVLLGFQDVLLPIIRHLLEKKMIPGPVYFLLDDADNLTRQQTQILNTWVSYRSTDYISLKISTQLNYKTYETTSGIHIESPHDFSSINFTSVLTGSTKERYPKLIADIVRKRLEQYGIDNPDPYIFFPEDEKQEQAIKLIAEEYKRKWPDKSGSYRPGDDAYRYARPEYIRRLSGASKQGSQYHYAGFEQLIHISSGIIRFFLEPAARMFTEQFQINNSQKILSISPSVQDHELRKQANQILVHDFDELMDEASCSLILPELRDFEKLRNIVRGIGALFRAHIMDEHITQRRVFSFSVSGGASEDIKKILKLGVKHGYFYLSDIGAKSGVGREILYVLTRRLAPAFSLDPTGFSGYLTVTNEFLRGISERPQTYVSRIKKRGVTSVLAEMHQPNLFEGGDDE